MGLKSERERVQCRVQVGESVHEFWVTADLLDTPASWNNDARQNAVVRRCAMSFVMAYNLEAARRRGDLGAPSNSDADLPAAD